MKTVALVGSGQTTMYAVKESKADEVWSLSWMYDQTMYPDVLPRMDRMFELHPFWYFQNSHKTELINHWRWMQQEHDFPVYIQEEEEGVVIPSGVVFPFDEINDDLFGGRLVSLMPDGTEEEDLYYSCSISFMIALAVYEKFECIELYGIEMQTSTEYKYQVPGANFMTGLAVGRGVKIVRPKNSTFARSALYAYEVAQVITRSQLDSGLFDYNKQLENEIAKMNVLKGRYQIMFELAKNGKVKPDRLADLSFEVLEAEKRVERCIGAVQAVEWQMEKIDLEEPEALVRFGGLNDVKDSVRL